VDKDSNLETGIRVEMDKFDSVMIEESAEEVTSRKAESALEEGGEHHNLIHSVLGCPPRQQDAIAAPRGPGESDSQQACRFHYHLQWAAGKGADTRRPWLGRRIATARSQS
jgi:hypothetical protein